MDQLIFVEVGLKIILIEGFARARHFLIGLMNVLDFALCVHLLGLCLPLFVLGFQLTFLLSVVVLILIYHFTIIITII